MDAQTLLELYSQTANNDNSLPKMEAQTCTLEITPTPLTSAETAYSTLVDFNPTQGWISFQSINAPFTEPESLPSMDSKSGKLLAAEVVNHAGESLHIRYDGNGGWIATRYAAKPDGEYLVDSVTHIANIKALGRLRYRRFWRIDSEQGIEPYAACFIGFGNQ